MLASSSRAALLRVAALSCLIMASVVGCASDPTTDKSGIVADTQHDPLEPVNRTIFDVNNFFDRLLFKPIALGYRYITPRYVRDRLSNIFDNMGEPVVMANSLLQGRVEDAGKSLSRLAVNSTLGIGGMFDVANEGIGWPAKDADFGQTLHTWGLGQGPYLVLPFFGPSTLRDAAGRGADMFMSPWGYVAMEGPHSTSSTFRYTNIGVNAVVQREKFIEQLDKLQEGSIDYYAQMRSLYLQFRNKQLGIAGQSLNSTYDDE